MSVCVYLSIASVSEFVLKIWTVSVVALFQMLLSQTHIETIVYVQLNVLALVFLPSFSLSCCVNQVRILTNAINLHVGGIVGQFLWGEK